MFSHLCETWNLGETSCVSLSPVVTILSSPSSHHLHNFTVPTIFSINRLQLCSLAVSNIFSFLFIILLCEIWGIIKTTMVTINLSIKTTYFKAILLVSSCNEVYLWHCQWSILYWYDYDTSCKLCHHLASSFYRQTGPRPSILGKLDPSPDSHINKLISPWK